MVNFGFNSASILGIFLAVAGAGLYFMRTLRPELSRDHDIFFAAVGLLSGFILIFQGWRLDPILQFSQLLLAGTAVFFAAETIRLRGFTTEQARRHTPIVDDERPATSRVYRAELAQIDGYEEEEEDYEKRRLQGTRDRNNLRRSAYEEEQPRPRRPRRTTSKYTDEPPLRSSRAKTSSRNRYEDWDETTDHWDDQPPTSRRPSRESRGSYPDETLSRPSRTTRKRRPKSAEDIVSSVGTEYVDYQPIDENEVKPRKPAPKPDNYPENPPEGNDSPHFDY
jgi:hypothetical protein